MPDEQSTLDRFWVMSLKELVVETLPKNEREHGKNHAEMARAVFQARVSLDAAQLALDTTAKATRAAIASAAAAILLLLVYAIDLGIRIWG